MSRYHPLRVKEIRRETSESVSVLLAIPEALTKDYAFKAGQFINVRTFIDGEEVRRSYSICSTPASGDLRIGVKKVPGGKFSTWVNDVLKAGDIIEAMIPEGKFILRDDDRNGNTYVFFAAGSGITPTIALIQTLLETREDVHVILFYGNRTIDSIMFRDALDALKNQHLGRLEIHHILSREQQEAPLLNGRIDPEKCRTFAKVFFNVANVNRFFICGPELMTFSLRECLIELGVDEKHIGVELFTTPGSKDHTPVAVEHKPLVDTRKECKVTVRLDGDTTEFTLAYGGQSILDAATNAGVDVPYSCKGGVCCTCKAMLLEGEVDMDVVYGLEPDEIEDGFILTCQSHPRSETLLVDYDIR